MNPIPARPHRGTLILSLGVLGLILPNPISLLAWYLGLKDLNAIRNGAMDRAGERATRTGYTLGIIGSVLFVLILLLWCGNRLMNFLAP